MYVLLFMRLSLSISNSMKNYPKTIKVKWPCLFYEGCFFFLAAASLCMHILKEYVFFPTPSLDGDSDESALIFGDIIISDRI